MKLYKLLVHLKEPDKYFKGLWNMDKKEEYETTLNTFIRAEKQNKCEIIMSGTTQDREDIEQYFSRVSV